MKGQWIDLNQLHALCKGDRTRMQRYIQMYLQGVPSGLNEIKTALAQGDGATASRLAHGLKPQISYMGADQLLEAIKSLEQLSLVADAHSCDDLFSQCLQLNDHVMSELTAFLNS